MTDQPRAEGACVHRRPARNLHGDPKRRQRDKLLMAKARMKGFQVVEITAEAQQDDGSLAVHLGEIAVYLGAG